MGRMLASTFVTLDNMMVGTDEDMSWVLDDFDPAMGEDMDTRVMGSMHAIVVGRTTYEIMAAHWPNVTEAEAPGADRMNQTPKYVFSRTLDKAPWGTYDNATVVHEIDVAGVRRLKDASPEPTVVMGSASIVRQLTTLGLIDEYVLWVHPVILGAGKPLFQDMGQRHRMRLVSTMSYRNGVVALTLRPSE